MKKLKLVVFCLKILIVAFNFILSCNVFPKFSLEKTCSIKNWKSQNHSHNEHLLLLNGIIAVQIKHLVMSEM